jgi:hypothetical protein
MPGGVVFTALLSSFLSICLGVSVLGVFGIEAIIPLMIFIMVFVCVGETMVLSKFRLRVFGVIPPCAAVLLPTLIAGRRFASGFCIASNAVSDTLGRRFGLIFPMFGVETPPEEKALCLNLFLAAFTVVGSCLAVYIVRGAGAARWRGAIPGLLLLCSYAMLLSLFDGSDGLWVFFSFAAFAAIFTRGVFSRAGWRRVGSGERISARAVCAVLLCALAVSATVSLAALYFPKGDTAADIEQEVIDALDRFRYGEGSSVLPRGDFTALADRVAQPGPARLEVSLSKPDSFWLRGFIGDRYDGQGWSPLPAGELYESAELFSRLHRSGFYGQTQLASAAAVVQEEEELHVTISNVGESSAYVFAPYELSGADGGLLRADGIGDERLRAKGLRGERSYHYATFGNLVKYYPQIASRIAEEGPLPGESGKNALSSTDGRQSYLIDESHYRRFVYDSYTDLPEHTRAFLAERLGSYDAASGERPSYASLKQRILSFLSDSGVAYSDELLRTSDSDGEDSSSSALKGDFLQTFLEKDKKGYDVHYATVAALIFRYYGVPARYVEGYLITPEDVRDAAANVRDAAADVIFTLDDTHAHAWSEFYLDGVGWVPFEASPAWIGVMEQPDDIAGSEQESALTGTPPATEGEEEAGSDARREERMAFRFRSAVLIPFLIALAAAVFAFFFIRFGKRRLALRRRMSLFRSEDPNVAVQALFSHALDLLSALGMEAENRSLFDRSSEIACIAGCSEDELLTVLRIHREARFGWRKLTGEEAGAMSSFREQVLAKLKTDLPWYEKLKLKVGAALY